MKKISNIDMWSIRDKGPKGGKTTKHFVKISFVNEDGVTISYSPYVFKKYEDAMKKYSELLNKIPLNIKIGKTNNNLMHNAWYLKPLHSDRWIPGVTNMDLFGEDIYGPVCSDGKMHTEKTLYVDGKFCNNAKKNKFAEKMMEAA